MLAPLRLRCQLHSALHFQIRTLRTIPRRIPTYAVRWDPTLHESAGSREDRDTPTALQQTAPDNQVRRAEREHLRDAQQIEVAHTQGQTVHRYPVHRLDQLLRLASSKAMHDPSIRAPLWRAYCLAKSSDPKLMGRLPDRAWDTLWSTQSVYSSRNRSRRAHLEQLYRDMAVVGKSITVGQRALYLESIFVSGNEAEALKQWEDDHNLSRGRARQDFKPEHLQIGAKMHALAGNVDRAREVMEELYSMYSDWDSAVMMIVFRAHTSSSLLTHHDRAQDIYIKMKERKGEARSLKDYDAWLVGFLEARHLEYAQQVFRDMVSDGYLAPIGAAEQVGELLKRLHLLYRLGTDISKMASIALNAISILPQEYHGHLFGDWMKSAVVEKAPEAASQILNMMFQRGYKPETFHFNMLLKALLRTDESSNVLKAENIGWRMIEETRKAHKRKVKNRTVPEAIHEKSTHRIDLRTEDAHAARNVPVGDVSTFALIMHHHAKSFQWEHVDYLTRQLKEAAVIPNDTIMNVLMDNKCRQGYYAQVWQIYESLTDPQPGTQGVFPNGATLRCLWKTLRLALGDPATREDPYLPLPRFLLKETVSWWRLSRARYDAPRFRQGLAGADSGAITALMLHCFSYTQDLPGSLIALHILKSQFGIYPTDKSAEILKRQIAWVDTTRDGAQYFHSKSNAHNTERLEDVFDILLRNRRVRMWGGRGESEKLTDEEYGEAMLNLQSEFIRVVLKRTYPPEVVEVLIEAAAEVVGVKGIETGDMDAFEVL